MFLDIATTMLSKFVLSVLVFSHTFFLCICALEKKYALAGTFPFGTAKGDLSLVETVNSITVPYMVPECRSALRARYASGSIKVSGI